MTHNEALARRLAEMFDGHAWHGPPVLATLRDLTPAQAAATPIVGAHSIWALALHMDTWQRVVTRRLEGNDSEVSDAENWPPVPRRILRRGPPCSHDSENPTRRSGPPCSRANPHASIPLPTGSTNICTGTFRAPSATSRGTPARSRCCGEPKAWNPPPPMPEEQLRSRDS
jgi:hypothetical protein